MSINSAMAAGVTGLSANASAVAAISDNIANANTVGYKRSQVSFSDLVNQQAVKSDYTAGGVAAVTATLVAVQGQLNPDASSTSLAINGDGMFVTTTDPTAASLTAPRYFTRAGQFTVDIQWYLKNTAGYYLQGWLADSTGAITANANDVTALKSINVQSQGAVASPTKNVSITANLQSTQTVSQAATDFGSATLADAYSSAATNGSGRSASMTAYNATTGTGTKPDYSIQIPVADSLGSPRTLQVDFLKSSTANQWFAEIHATPTSDVTSGTGLVPGQIARGIVAFTPTGQYDPTNSTLFTAGAVPTISLGASSGTPGAGAANWASGLGVNAQSIALSTTNALSGLTQFATPSVVNNLTTDGTNLGNLNGVAVDEKGFVTASYDNGVTRTLAQVAIATFANPDGLAAISGDAFTVTRQSGSFNLKAANSAGAGKIAPKNLESSTVDLSSEFTNLIVTQRAYSASSKIITTADQMLQDLLSIVR